MLYSITNPIDGTCNAVEELIELTELAGYPYTTIQQVNMGYLIVSKKCIFRDDVRKWIRKLDVENTWQNFIDHFRQAHQEIRDTDSSIDKLGFHSVNAIVE